MVVASLPYSKTQRHTTKPIRFAEQSAQHTFAAHQLSALVFARVNEIWKLVLVFRRRVYVCVCVCLSSVRPLCKMLVKSSGTNNHIWFSHQPFVWNIYSVGCCCQVEQVCAEIPSLLFTPCCK